MNLARASFFRRTALAVSLATAAQSIGLPVIACAQAQPIAPDAQAASQPVTIAPPDAANPLAQGAQAPLGQPQPLQIPRLPPGVPMRATTPQPGIMPSQPAMAPPQVAAPQYATPAPQPQMQMQQQQQGQPQMQPQMQQQGQPQMQQQGQQQGQHASLPELQALVAPIALYPDSLLAQMMIAATYPLDVAAATIWIQDSQNARLSGPALEAALQPQRWDNSVKSLVQFPDALRMLGNKLEWTQKLGDAYLAQPSELMQAVQALRTQARNAGHLQSGTQMTVRSDPQSNILIEPANPQVVYVPMYNPYMVYGPWGYPAYPPWPVYNPGWGYLAFGVGFGVGAALWATPYWGRGYVYVNHGYYNRFNAAYNAPMYRGPGRPGAGGPWVYNPAQRGNVPYTNAALQSRYAATPAQRQQVSQARAAAQGYWNKNPGARPTGGSVSRAAPVGTGASSTGGARSSGGTSSGGGGGGSRGGGGHSGRH